ncbi:hypothetical protein DPEC_G00232310 [Dallia pectoralis]|uniref:Uncharacterized protein n=1 Tax=Dallia pectoralis TaxID=75939 RepID=A0ACC2FX50_DALPE|nr:hypothetical protein DPEC_G00232310 [Dallia pectoralis]
MMPLTGGGWDGVVEEIDYTTFRDFYTVATVESLEPEMISPIGRRHIELQEFDLAAGAHQQSILHTKTFINIGLKKVEGVEVHVPGGAHICSVTYKRCSDHLPHSLDEQQYPPQVVIMKLVSLALTLLLSVGSQARALQNDAPSQLKHIKAAATVYPTQVKETGEKTLGHLDGTQYAKCKLKLSESFDKLHEYTQSASHTLSPYGDAFTAQFLEATKHAREKVMADVEDPSQPAGAQEYISKNQEDMDALRAKLKPLVDEMRPKVQVNVDETKSKLLPIIEVVRTKLMEYLEELKNMASPYVVEYKEHLVKAVDDVKNKLMGFYHIVAKKV